MRYCVECGTPFEVEGAGRPPIRCPEHRQMRTLREIRLSLRRATCRECGTEFTQPRGKPFLYCEEHRGVLNSTRRSLLKRGVNIGAGRGAHPHECGERCAEIERLIQQVPVPTLQAMGKRFGITREAVRQIIRKHGWSKGRSGAGTTCPTCEIKFTESMRAHRQSMYHKRAMRERRGAMASRKMNWDLGAFIYALHKAGYKPTEITYLTDSYPLAPYRWLNMLGENPYVRGPVNRLNPQVAAERDRKVALAYAEGQSTETIMETFDIKHGNLYRIIKEQGVKRPEWHREEFYRLHLPKMRAAARRMRETARLARMSDKA